jgi:protoporphyrin/coproporphyrin ferrochelatase
MMKEWAVLLMAYGGPDSLDDVEPYLLDIRGGRKTSPELVEEIRGRYEKIGGKSPLLDITQAQAKALEDRLNRDAEDEERFRVYVGMRHWSPAISETVHKIYQDGLRTGVAICMTPYLSRMSVGAYYQKLDEGLQALPSEDDSHSPILFQRVQSWHDHPLFIQAIADRVQQALEKFPDEERNSVPVLFSAHSLPVAILAQGDPYVDQLMQTAQQSAEKIGLEKSRWQFCFQSAGAQNTQWLGPDLEEKIDQLAKAGKKNVLVAPIGFVSDHVEILFDIDIEATEFAHSRGLRLERTTSMNTYDLFIDALADIVRSEIRGSHEHTN